MPSAEGDGCRDMTAVCPGGVRCVSPARIAWCWQYVRKLKHAVRPVESLRDSRQPAMRCEAGHAGVMSLHHILVDALRTAGTHIEEMFFIRKLKHILQNT